MGDHYCDDCGLIYFVGIHPLDCDVLNGNLKHRYHDVEKGFFYLWDRSVFSSNIGGGLVSTIRSGQGRNRVETKIMYIDLQDFVNNLQDVLGEIYSHLTRNAITVEVIVYGTLSQHNKAKLTDTKKGHPRFISKKLSWMKLIGIKLSLIVFDNSTQKRFKVSRFEK